VPISTKKGIISTDEEPKNLRKDKIPKIKPVFGHDGLVGTITGANASKINDGACSLLLASQESVNKYKLKPIAEIISFADAELSPELFNETPILAMKMAIEKAKL
jgi:acetyl-CoA C-acetyltransferase